MNHRFASHLFWGPHSPLSALSGTGLIIMASNRFAYALVCAGALIWVNGLATLVYSAARPIMPSRGKMMILLFLSAFLCGLFVLFTSLLSPLLILGTTFFLVLVPPWCLSSGFFETFESEDTIESVSRALLEGITLAGIIIAFSLIREPLGMGTLSLPGGAQGVTELFNFQDSNVNALFPARIISVSSGGLLLMGYITALYRYFREQNGGVSGGG